MTAKKFQIFVSSTYLDLASEREAAVEAILESDHIPAGMELFRAGRPALEIIYRWIDESDILLLIVGHRYGSIEPQSGKSYTELEYDYALSKGKRVFAIVMSEEHRNVKLSNVGRVPLHHILEQDNPHLYKSFKDRVMCNIVYKADDHKDLKNCLLRQFSDKAFMPNSGGWVRDTQGLLSESNGLLEIIYQNQGTLQDKKLISELISNSKHQFLFSGINMYLTIENCKDLLLNKLKEGLHCEFLFANPEASFFDVFAESLQNESSWLKNESQRALTLFANLVDEFNSSYRKPHARNELRIRISPHIPLGRVYCFDPLEPEGRILVIPYINGLRPAYAPAFLFKADSQSGRQYKDACSRAFQAGTAI